MQIITEVPTQEALAHQRPNRPEYPPADIALETLADPHWSELAAWLVAVAHVGFVKCIIHGRDGRRYRGTIVLSTAEDP